jgi:Mlc titration factor MtfA (ptsG expression regulator)
MFDEYRRLQRAERKQQETLLDPYGAQNPAEFFAVATECFFERSAAMAQKHGELYAVLRGYYGQDPARRP